MSRKEEVRESIDACNARIADVEKELDGLQADQHAAEEKRDEAEEELKQINSQVRELASKKQQEEVRLANFEVEMSGAE